MPSSASLPTRVAIPLALVLAGCSSSSAPGPDGGGGGDLPSGICARESRAMVGGQPVVLCEEAFATAPLVRLPPDSESGGVQLVYGGVRHAGTTGVEFAGRNVSFAVSPGTPWLAAESGSGEVRYGYLLYRARVRGGAVEAVTPVARIDDRIMQMLLAGKVLEGTASSRMVDPSGQPSYALTDLDVPMRIRLEAAAETSAHDQLTGFPRFAVLGIIENASKAVRGTDGRCLPSLASQGERSPIFGATGQADRVFILRHPNMHGTVDDVFTMDWPPGISTGNNMGDGLFIATADLIQATAPNPTRAESHPHGNPTAAPSADLLVVSGGGEDCMP